ncbi:hypothetical protein [Burkholderia cepacia]|uniref:hypothetical protein n=1 Tax=Burkholderia cepacia TaxID=292 RepID=UPI000F5AB065|nr:hypothetical protein [Burkholderia cepacia]
MIRFLFTISVLALITGCAEPLPLGYHYEPGSFTPTKNVDDGLVWCKPYVSYRVTSEECDATIVSVQNYPAAQVQQEKQRICFMKGAIYRQAASMRDDAMSPQITFSALKSFEQNGIKEQFLKNAINQVYFDRRFINAGGQALANQISGICMHPNGIFKPLE